MTDTHDGSHTWEKYRKFKDKLAHQKIADYKLKQTSWLSEFIEIENDNLHNSFINEEENDD